MIKVKEKEIVAKDKAKIKIRYYINMKKILIITTLFIIGLLIVASMVARSEQIDKHYNNIIDKK